MKRKLEVSELIFKIISYTLLTVFALACLYPFIYAISAATNAEKRMLKRRTSKAMHAIGEMAEGIAQIMG